MRKNKSTNRIFSIVLSLMLTMALFVIAPDVVVGANYERIYADIVSIDPSVTRRGCAVGIRLSCDDVGRVKSLLEKKNIPYGDVIGRSRDL